MQDHLASGGYIGPSDSPFPPHPRCRRGRGAINGFYRRYHSLRFAAASLIRMSRSCRPPASRAQAGVRDLIVDGGDMVLSGALAQECDEPGIAHLPRLSWTSTRRILRGSAADRRHQQPVGGGERGTKDPVRAAFDAVAWIIGRPGGGNGQDAGFGFSNTRGLMDESIPNIF